MEVVLRKATINDLQTLTKWDQADHLVGQVPTDDWHWEEELKEESDWRYQFIAEVKGDPIGYIDIIDPYFEPSKYWGAIGMGFRALDIWIGEKDFLGKGYGTRMMLKAIDFCFADQSVHTIVLDPFKENIRAHQFYERLGFEFLEERNFDGDDCFVYHLTRNIYHAKNL